ncbi:testis-specific gene 10 protein [Clarias gariepinus]|uniref:testis-specific gene 10 protein n=1 Tax=Clarias gariepinus TaxID=13013 RepID=UPI00234CC251|nr:testis-specific gene 10 protein [Clarias gariepinus]
MALKDKTTSGEKALNQSLNSGESQQGELKDHNPSQLENPGKAKQKEDIRTELPQLDEDGQQSQLSSEADQELQTLLSQSKQGEVLTQGKRLGNTESAYITDNTVSQDSCNSGDVHNSVAAERMKGAKSRKSTSPARQTHVKGGTYDSELIRVMRERDEMKSMLDKCERQMSETQGNIRVLMAERDKARAQYQRAQEEIAELRREVLKSKVSQGSKYSVTAQSILKRVESERDEAMSDLHHMTTERDSLRERLKISQETAIYEKAHMEQRIEDLQNALLTMEQERAEHKGRQAQMRETMMRLEEQVNTLTRSLTASYSECSCLKNECSMLRQSNTQAENTLSETQKRLINRIGDLQRVQKKNKDLDERNDSLMKEVTVLKEQLNVMQSTVSELNHHRDIIQEQLERKNDLLCSVNKELDDKENSIHNLKLHLEDLEAALDASNETQSSRDRELNAVRRKLMDSGDELNAVLKLKDATLRDNTQLRDELDQVRLENKSLQFRVDEAGHEIGLLERKVQSYVSDISNIEDLLSSKEQEVKELQECRMELRTSDSEKRRLKERVECLESSLQEALSAEQSCSAELRQVKFTLEKQEEELRQVKTRQLDTTHDLEKTRDLCFKLDTGKEAVQQELESCRSELELLRKHLALEREKELNRQLSSQERLVEIQLLRDKLAVADSKTSTQCREMAQLRTQSALLEADLEATRRQLNTERDERERVVKELHRHGHSTSFGSPILSSTLRTPPSTVRHSLSPQTSYSPERSHHATLDHLPRSPDRSVTFKNPYD